MVLREIDLEESPRLDPPASTIPDPYWPDSRGEPPGLLWKQKLLENLDKKKTFRLFFSNLDNICLGAS